MFTKRRSLYYSLGVFFIALLIGVCFTLSNFQKTDSVMRTVTLNESVVDYQELAADFDEFDIQTNEKDVEIVAQKKFDMSILDELNMVGLDENSETFTVRYEVSYIDNDSTLFLTVTMLGTDEIPVIETIPGLVSNNSAGEPDVMFVVDGEYIWLSDMIDAGVLDETGWFKNLFKAITKAVATAAQNVVKALAPIIKPIVNLTNNVIITLFGRQGAAAFGAMILDMEEETNNKGVYHARFDCWQKNFGYTDFYDTVFNAVTSMKPAKFDFDVNGDGYMDYILWAWKGDYLNLGAGAELGIYKRWAYSDVIWMVDKSQAMKMTLKLDYKGTNIIDWNPPKNQWWITGFNSNYQKKYKNDLTATFTVVFNNYTMYNGFKDRWSNGENKWDLTGGLGAKFSF